MMNRFGTLGRLAAVPLAVVLSAAPALAGDSLVMNGKTASTDVRTLGGSAYVKLSDVAKALGMTLVKRPGGYEITKAGGANQVQGVTQGKVGDVLFDGQWRFQVLSVQTPDAYTMLTPGNEPSAWPRDIIEYDGATHVLRAKPSYKLVVVQCRMTNGQKTTERFWLAAGPETKTALTDTEGGSHAPVGFDLESGPNQSSPLLPGAAVKFPMLFSIPEAARLQDLVFTIKNNGEGKIHDVRVSLTPGAHD